MGASDMHTVKAFLEAEAYDGPSIIIAYSHCIAHGYDMAHGMEQQKAAVNSGYWPLFRYNPDLAAQGKNPFQLDSRAAQHHAEGLRLQRDALHHAGQEQSGGGQELLELAQEDVASRWKTLRTHGAPAGRTARKKHRGEEMIDLCKTIDLSTTYLGLKLKNPLVASSSPMCEDVGNIRRMEDAGAAAVVLHSLFEEQIELESDELDRFITRRLGALGRSRSPTFPELTQRVMGPDAYLEHIAKCKQAVRIPVIASLNGTTMGGWLRYARQMEQAGADALELNIYYIPVDPNVTGEQVEQQYVDLVKAVKAEVHIPVAVKLGPYFSSMANMAKQLDAAGRRRPGAVQPLLPAGLRPGSRWKWCPT